MALLALPAVVVGIQLLRGYSFPIGEEVDYLVILRRLLHPEYLQNDWYATTSVESLVRLPYLLLLAGPVMLIGEAATLAVLSGATLFVIAYLVGLTLFRAGAPLPAAIVASLAALPAGLTLSVGDSQIVDLGVRQADFAWLLAFGSLALGLSDQRPLALIGAAAATLFNPTVGLLAYGSHLGLAVQRGEWRTPRSAMTFLLAGVFTAMWPALLIAEGGGDGAAITAVQVFNFPPHWLISARARSDVVLPGLGLVVFDPLMKIGVAVTVIALAWTLGRRYHPLLYWTLALALGATLASAVAGELGGPSFLITMQGMRLSVVLGPLAVGAGAWLAWDVVRVTRLSRLVDLALSPAISFALMVVGVVLSAYALVTPQPSLAPDAAALRDATIATTPADAILLIPPDLSWFRVETSRAIVVDWKGWPFRAHDAIEWRDRVETIAPGFDGHSPYPLELAAEHYDALSPQRLLEAADRYGATHIVVRRQDLSCSGGRELARIGTSYVLYALSEAKWWDPARPCAATTARVESGRTTGASYTDDRDIESPRVWPDLLVASDLRSQVLSARVAGAAF